MVRYDGLVKKLGLLQCALGSSPAKSGPVLGPSDSAWSLGTEAESWRRLATANSHTLLARSEPRVAAAKNGAAHNTSAAEKTAADASARYIGKALRQLAAVGAHGLERHSMQAMQLEQARHLLQQKRWPRALAVAESANGTSANELQSTLLDEWQREQAALGTPELASQWQRCLDSYFPTSSCSSSSSCATTFFSIPMQMLLHPGERSRSRRR